MRADRIRIAVISLLLLIPCFWQRIQAGDLGSHIYNSWLAQQIELGKAPGLRIAMMQTNVLFDLVLSRLFESFGPEAAQRIAVSLCVLIFFWGAFALASAETGVRPWFILPCLAMLTYGWTFHMGFFNFYLALGLSLWAVALLAVGGRQRNVAAVILLAIAYTGHSLPPVWAVAVVSYKWAAQRLPARFRIVLMAPALAGIIGLKFWLSSHYSVRASFHQILEAGAIDQVWVYGIKYCAISIGLAFLWGFLLLRASYVFGPGGLIAHPLFQICALMGAATVLLPSSIELPGHALALSFITERMTLAYAAMTCALLAGAKPERWQRVSFYPLALVYFSLLYVDTRTLNRVEDKMEELVRPLSLSDRVFSSFEDPVSRVQIWGHNLDRVCVGKCLSYANYEPFTQLFRVRTIAENPWVAANPADVAGLQDGGYRVKPRDLPMYQITFCEAGKDELCLRRLAAGDITRHDQLSILPLWW